MKNDNNNLKTINSMENNLSDESSSSPSQSNFEILDYDFLPIEWTLEALRQAAIQQRLVRPRSLAWAILLHALPSAQGDIVKSIKTHRNFYDDLKTKLSMDPRAVIGDDPLSQNDESVWKQHFCDNELKAVIMQDVVRTFPDELYFRDKDVQDMLVRVLFFWARTHSHVGYRQGMHEILAPILFEMFQDRRFAPRDVSEVLKCVLDDDYLEHDSYMLFNAVMKGLERFYTTGDVVPTSCGRLPTSKVTHNPNEVVRYLDKVKEEFLVPLDHEVASHLDQCNITMELFGIRWLRLLFGREFSRSEIPHLWGFLFADGPSLPHLHFVVLAMLISIRNTILDADSGSVLSALMRPCPLSAAHVSALALHLRAPLEYARPPPPPPPPPPRRYTRDTGHTTPTASALMRPCPLSAAHVSALALHLRAPLEYARPPPPPPPRRYTRDTGARPPVSEPWAIEHTGAPHDRDADSGSEGVPEDGDVAREQAVLALSFGQTNAGAWACAVAWAWACRPVHTKLADTTHSGGLARKCVPEGGDVARELAALALVRARLPGAAAALAAALPRPPPHVAQPLQQILQLAALLQCRNHALIDVETALEAAEGHNSDKVGRRQLVPVSLIPKKTPVKTPVKIPNKVKEVQLKVFHQTECESTSDLPFSDPLGLRTE